MRERIAPPFSLRSTLCFAWTHVGAPRGCRKRRQDSRHWNSASHCGGRGRGSVREDLHSSESRPAKPRLPVIALLLWALLAFAVPMFAQALNLIDIFALPLGYFMVAQGSLIALVLVGLASARWQDRHEARRATDA